MRATPQHLEIPVDDLDRAAAFYRQALGWDVTRVPWDGPAYCSVRVPETPEDALPRSAGGGLMGREDLGTDHPLPMIHIEDATLEEALRRIEDAGGTVDRPPEAVGKMGAWARFRDTEGNLFGLWRDA